jgi:hypothetical protein
LQIGWTVLPGLGRDGSQVVIELAQWVGRYIDGPFTLPLSLLLAKMTMVVVTIFV